MRVLLVTHRYPPDGIAGVERYTQHLAAELVRAGDVVDIITRRPDPAIRHLRTLRERLPDGTRIHRLVGGDVRLDRFLLHYEQLELLYTMAILEARPDIVHINHLIGLSPRFIQIAHRHGAAVVLTLHDYYFACPLFQLRQRSGALCDGPDDGHECIRTCFAGEGALSARWRTRTAYFRRLLATAERIIAPSRHLASYFEHFGAETTCLRVIPNGIVIDRAEAWEFSADRAPNQESLNLVFLGVVAPHKGVHVILEALHGARLTHVQLTVLGQIADRQYARSLREQAARIPGLTFRMYGAYQPTELRHLLRDTDCVIVPSQWPENFPLVTQEALARGIPLIAARLGGLPEIVSEGVNGFTFDHSRPEDLAAILQRLAHDQELLQRIRRGAQASPLLTMAQHADTVRTLYSEALDEFGRRDAASKDQELTPIYSTLLSFGFGS